MVVGDRSPSNHAMSGHSCYGEVAWPVVQSVTQRKTRFYAA